MVDFPRYVVAKSNNGVLSVWNVVKGGCAGKAVLVERGLADSNDVMLIRNTKVIILTDRGYLDAGDGDRTVFQSVRIYDLLRRKYTARISGCYIVPSPPHEYVILDDKSLLGLSANRKYFVVWSLGTGHPTDRMKPFFKKSDLATADAAGSLKEAIPVKTYPWDLRETKSALERKYKAAFEEERQRVESLRKEKENAVDQFVISRDLKVIVASYYAHHMCVFDVASMTHVQTLENVHSMLFLHFAALTPTGSHLVHANYDDDTKSSYVTLWDCASGAVERRLKKEKNVCAIAVTDQAEKIVFGKANGELRIWQPGRNNSLKKITGHSCLNFGVNSRISISEAGDQAVVYAGDLSAWDLKKGILLAVFSPDTKITCLTSALGGKLTLFCLGDSADVVALRLSSCSRSGTQRVGSNMFGEKDDTSDDEEEEQNIDHET